jgi:hypothetical protein
VIAVILKDADGACAIIGWVFHKTWKSDQASSVSCTWCYII